MGNIQNTEPSMPRYMKGSLWGVIILVISLQGYRFSRNFEPKESQGFQTILPSDPCEKLEGYPVQESTRMPILLVNCWPKLHYQGRYPKDALFPLDFGRRFRNFQKVYDIAINQNTRVKLDQQDQAILSSILSGDEMRRIQGLYFLCSYPSLISQINLPKKTLDEQFNHDFLQSCQQNFRNLASNFSEKTGLRYYFTLSKEEQRSQFQEYFIP